MDQCPRRCRFHLVRRNVQPALVVLADVVVDPAYTELALRELLRSQVLFADVVGDGLLCGVLDVDLKLSSKVPGRPSNQRVYLF